MEDQEKRSSYKSRQPKAGPAPFASFEDLSDCLEDSSPEEIVPLPVLDEDNVFDSESLRGTGGNRDSVISPEYEREILQRNRDISVTFGFKESGSSHDLRRSADELENREPRFRRESGNRSSYRGSVSSGAPGPYVNYNFRMIDASRENLGPGASREDLMDLEARRRRASATSSNFGAEMDRRVEAGNTTPPPGLTRVSSISSSSSGLRSGSPHTMLIESSFCGPKPIPTPSLDMAEEKISLSSEDGAERDLVAEIQAKTKLPITKQDSYGHAIYHGAARKNVKNVKKQGSYEAAVESGAHKAIEMRRTKRILKIRKQDSYTRAIGGSFEDEHSRSEARKERSGMKKQDSYLRAVGEVSPDTESKSDFSSISEINIRKQDSYIEAIRSTSPLDEVPELASRSRTTRRQASYLQAVQADHLSAGERATFRAEGEI